MRATALSWWHAAKELRVARRWWQPRAPRTRPIARPQRPTYWPTLFPKMDLRLQQAVRKNIERRVAQQLQDLGTEFRRGHKTYLASAHGSPPPQPLPSHRAHLRCGSLTLSRRPLAAASLWPPPPPFLGGAPAELKGQTIEEYRPDLSLNEGPGAATAGGTGFFDEEAAPSDAGCADPRFSAAQTLQLVMAERMTEERERAITQVAESVGELAEIFKEIQVHARPRPRPRCFAAARCVPAPLQQARLPLTLFWAAPQPLLAGARDRPGDDSRSDRLQHRAGAWVAAMRARGVRAGGMRAGAPPQMDAAPPRQLGGGWPCRREAA